MVVFDVITVLLIGIALALIGVTVAAVALLYLRRNERAQDKRFAAEREFYASSGYTADLAFILADHPSLIPHYVSAGITDLTGIAASDVACDIWELLRATDHATARTVRARAESWDGQRPLHIEVPFHNLASNAEGTIAVDAAITKQGSALIVFRDMTTEQKLRDDLNREAEEAKTAEQTKADFLSNMSHEIRTPMNGISGMLSLARMNIHDNPDEADRYLERVDDLTSYLLNLINNVLDMSKIDSGKMELSDACFDLFETINTMDELFRKQVESKGVAFNVEIDEFPQHYVLGDEMRISQVLSNLLSNSMKFTEKGAVTLKLHLMQVAEGTVHIMLGVSDTGKGMSPDFLTRIFNPFVQENASISKHYGGTGLGMAITDSLVHLMGGQVVVESREGEGSSFSVYLPLKIADKETIETFRHESDYAEADGAGDYDFTGKTILLAEDNRVNAEIAITMLKMKGASVQHATDGEMAVDMFRASSPNTFDLVFMDIQMPKLDGWQATTAIRELPRTDARTTPIFAMSANAFVEDIRRSKDIGMTGHLAKPIDFDTLEYSVGSALSNSQRRNHA